MVFLQSLYHALSISSCSSSLFLMIMMMMMMMMMMMNLLVFAAAGPTGLTMKLIHRDSPGSPLNQGNLTKLEQMERAIERSIHHEQRLISTWQHQIEKKQVSSSMNNNTTTTNNSKSSDTDMVRPKVKYFDSITYMAELGLGSFSHDGHSLFPLYYYFFFDTGSDLLWLQCDPGGTKETHYFPQDPEYFRGEYSATYHPLSYSSEDPICEDFVTSGMLAEGGKYCPYKLSYADGGSTEGVLATEKLTVNADNGGVEEINNFVFGCGYRQVEPNFGRYPDGQNPVVGVVGLGGGKASLIRQLGDRAQNKFEYCLKPLLTNDHPDHSHTFLRFGSDTKIVKGGPNVQTTATFHAIGQTHYYVNMVGISVNGQPIVYPEGSDVFGTRPDGTGGCIFDSGTGITKLSAEVYAPFREHLVTYFSAYGIQTTAPSGRLTLLDLCFPLTPGFNAYPTIRFYFSGGAILEMQPLNTFFKEDQVNIVCLAMRPSNGIRSVVIGANEQVDHRILHDLSTMEISWTHEYCGADQS